LISHISAPGAGPQAPCPAWRHAYSDLPTLIAGEITLRSGHRGHVTTKIYKR
jgi:hypothetical protein